MKRKRQWNERTRMILTLELAVVLPAAALVLLSAWHLHNIQRDRAVEAAIQRDFNHVLAVSEKQFNRKVSSLIEDVRSASPAPGEACSETLDRILGAHPYAAHVLLYDPKHGLVFRSQPDRVNEPYFRAEATYLSSMSEGWLQMEFTPPG